MRIVYGVSGEGSGHSSRARVILRHLERQGHQVKVVSYDRGYRNLREEFDVFETEGLSIATADNKVSLVKTFTENLARLSDGVRKLRELRALLDEFQPQVALTDFEPMTAHLARHRKLPLISIDNQHRMRYMRYPCPDNLKKDALVTETVIRAMVPSPDAALVTTFFFGQTTNPRTFLFPPLLREEVLALKERAQASAGDSPGSPGGQAHVLVYFTRGFESFLSLLPEFPRERFVIYGASQGGPEAPNLEYHAPSQHGFLEHLVQARAVIATAGFTLLTESLFLAKPYLALPMKGQFEQELNAYLLAESGYGVRYDGGGTDEIAAFLYRLPEYERQLASYDPGTNAALCARLDELLADDAAELAQLVRSRETG